MKYLFLILTGIISVQLYGQELSLTYDEAVKIALEQNVTLRTQFNELKIAEAERAQSIGELAPNVSIRMNGSRNYGNTFIEQQATNIDTISHNINGQVSADINIFSGFSQLNKIKLYRANLDAQLQVINRTSQEVILTVSNQYLQVLLDTELVQIANDNLKTQEVLYSQIEAMVEAGNRPKSDLYDQLATVKNRELQLLQAKNTLSNDMSLLAITLQLDPTVNFSISNPNWDLDEIQFSEINLDELYETSMKKRPDLRQFEYSEIVASKSVAVAKAAFAPTLYGYYGLGSRYSDALLGSFGDQFGDEFKNMQIGLTLNIPIYSGLRNRTQLVRQKVQYENSKINTENLEKTILNDVKQAYQNFQDIRTAYQVSLAQFEAADMALKVQNEKYQLGVGSLIELTNSNNNYVLAASRRAQAKLNLMFQKIILEYNTGTLQIP